MYGLRLLVLDGGYSTVEPAFSLDPIPRSWQAVKDLQTDAACQIVLICGTTFTKKQKAHVLETFPDWTIKYKSNACDGNLALVDPAAAHVVVAVAMVVPFCGVAPPGQHQQLYRVHASITHICLF